MLEPLVVTWGLFWDLFTAYSFVLLFVCFVLSCIEAFTSCVCLALHFLPSVLFPLLLIVCLPWLVHLCFLNHSVPSFPTIFWEQTCPFFHYVTFRQLYSFTHLILLVTTFIQIPAFFHLFLSPGYLLFFSVTLHGGLCLSLHEDLFSLLCFVLQNVNVSC